MTWDALFGLLEFNAGAAEREQATAEHPTVCPHDGYRLRRSPDGDLVCPLGNYRTPA